MPVVSLSQGWRVGGGSRSRGSRGFSGESESKNYACQSRSRKNMLNSDYQSFAGMEGLLSHEQITKV